jgi:hypothetical protein
MNTVAEKIPALLTPRGPAPVEEPVVIDQDGVTHINISSTGATELGRQLTHFAFTPFIHPIYGHFKCMEGLWHYIKSEDKDDAFRSMTGGKAKGHARNKRTVKRPNFINIIKEANFHKIEQTPGLKELLISSTLPFEYYYFFGPEQILVTPPHATWLCGIFEELRRMFKDGERMPVQPVIDFTQRADEAFVRRA